MKNMTIPTPSTEVEGVSIVIICSKISLKIFKMSFEYVYIMEKKY